MDEHQTLAKQLWLVSQESFLYGSPWSVHQFEEDLAESSSNWLLKKNSKDELIGFLQYRIMFDEAEIYNVAVSRHSQGQGIGSQLMAELKMELMAQDVQQLFLEVRQSNQQAREFYQKHGFVEVSVRKNYYHHPLENGLILMKELK